MTFILTELSDFGIIMAADSSETIGDKNGTNFKEVDKIIYFPDFNIGISTWGDAIIENKDINSWLKEKIEEFKRNNALQEPLKNKYLRQISEYLANKLRAVFPNGESILGLHVSGFTYSEEEKDYRPGIFHVHNHNPENVREIRRCLTKEHKQGPPTLFVAEATKPMLEKGGAVHVRNGIYEEFALFFPALQGLKETFRNIVMISHENLKTDDMDLIKIEAESVANWVRLMCNTFTEAGLIPCIGKKIRVLALQADNYRKFTLDEFREEQW